MKFIHFENKKIAYDVKGKGTTLLLLHGYCSDSRIWEEFIEDLPYQIIRIDLPGFGQSEVIPNLSIELMADCVKQVLDSIGIKKCILIGHSMGGYVGLAFAKKYKEILIGLGLFNSHPFKDSEVNIKNRKRSLSFIEKNGHLLYVKLLVPQLFGKGSSENANRFIIETLTHRAINYDVEGVKASLIAMLNRSDNQEVLEKVDIPILFIIGKLDQLIPLEMNLKQLTFPKIASIHILSESGHMAMFESSRKTKLAVKEFCDYCLGGKFD